MMTRMEREEDEGEEDENIRRTTVDGEDKYGKGTDI
jgi:hypothetical protein